MPVLEEMAEDKDRFRRAIDFMKVLGLTHAVVAPLLKRLLKLYDNEWSLIEEENYRVLADSYFEQQESQGSRKKDAAKPQVVTRNKARKSASTPEGSSRQVHQQETVPISAQDNTPSSSMHNSLASESRVECVSYNENRGDKKKIYVEAPILAQENTPRSSICNSPALESQVECVRYKEKRAGKDKIHVEEAPPKKLKMGEPASPSVVSPLKKSLLSTSGVVKEEPFELKDAKMENKQKSNEIAPYQEPMLQDGRPMTAACPVEAEVVLRQDKQIDNKEDFEDDVSGLVKPSVRYGHVQQEPDSLSAIAAAYRCMSGESFGQVTDFDLADSHHSVLVRNNGVNGEWSSDHSNQSRVGVLNQQQRESPQNHLLWKAKVECPNHLDSSNAEAKALVGKKLNMVVKQEPETQYRDEPVSAPSRKARREKNKNAAITNADFLSHGESDAVDEKDRLGIVTKQHQQFSWDEKETHRHNVDDISRGEEKVPIPLVNNSTSQSLPETFYYISKSIIYQNAYVNFSLARIGDDNCCGHCHGDCLKASFPCACARETGGEYAYTYEGRLCESFLQEALEDKRNFETIAKRMCYCEAGLCPTERGKNESNPESCKGHLMRRFVKECWSKCGCGMHCGNRLVQRGISYKLQVFMSSEGKGWGVRTLEDLPAGTFVCEYVGEILTNIELDTRNSAMNGHPDHYPVLLDADWSSENVLKDEEALCLDATHYGNVARFINHRCYDANLVDIPVEIESPDHHYYHIAFFTTRPVKALEELTWDYCIDFEDHDHPIKAFQCLCKSPYCRGRGQKL